MNITDSRITSNTQKTRLSNIELLRIVAMFLVLVVHADFYSLGVPTQEDYTNNPISFFTRSIFQSISIVCVDVFVLISGWFGIKASFKGFASFVFQCAYFMFGIYAVMLISGMATFSFKGLSECFCLTTFYWFVTSYVGLYIVSPILNAFIEKASKRQYTYVLIAFFLFQTIFGWRNSAPYFQRGYSAFSFIGLYLLARYVKLFYYQSINKLTGGVLYVLSVSANTIFFFLMVRFNIPIDPYVYVSPIVIIGALGLLLFFSRIKIGTNKYINFIAKSAFAAYLLHQNPNLFLPYFKPLIQYIFNSSSGFECLAIIASTLVGIFFISILIDQPRKWLWTKISNNCFLNK